MQDEQKNFFVENKKVFRKYLSKRDYKISRMRWELNKNSEEIAKELNLNTQEVFLQILKCTNFIKKNKRWKG